MSWKLIVMGEPRNSKPTVSTWWFTIYVTYQHGSRTHNPGSLSNHRAKRDFNARLVEHQHCQTLLINDKAYWRHVHFLFACAARFKLHKNLKVKSPRKQRACVPNNKKTNLHVTGVCHGKWQPKNAVSVWRQTVAWSTCTHHYARPVCAGKHWHLYSKNVMKKMSWHPSLVLLYWGDIPITSAPAALAINDPLGRTFSTWRTISHSFTNGSLEQFLVVGCNSSMAQATDNWGAPLASSTSVWWITWWFMMIDNHHYWGLLRMIDGLSINIVKTIKKHHNECGLLLISL